MKFPTLTLAQAEGFIARLGKIHGAYVMDEADYHKAPGWSSSVLGESTLSKAKAAHDKLRTVEESDAMRLGTACHSYVLEPETFYSLYAVEPEELAGKNKAKKIANGGCLEDWKAFKAEVRGRRVLTRKEFQQVQGVSHAIYHRHSAAKDHIHDVMSHSELSVFWTDPPTGLQCRARFDKIHPIMGATDLKTTGKSAQPDQFLKSIKWGWDGKEGYWLQHSHYLAGLRCVFPDWVPTFKWLVVETHYPYDCSMIRLDSDEVERYASMYRRQMELIARATEQEDWPAYGDDVHVLGGF